MNDLKTSYNGHVLFCSMKERKIVTIISAEMSNIMKSTMYNLKINILTLKSHAVPPTV